MTVTAPSTRSSIEETERVQTQAAPWITDTMTTESPQGELADTDLPTSTPEPEANGSPQASEMYDLVLDLHQMGILKGIEGTHHTLPDFDDSWASIDNYDWKPTLYAPADFVIRADIGWDSASNTANWWNSGCGFVFRTNARGDHYLALLGLDGWVSLYRNLDGSATTLARGYREPLEIPKGEAELVMVAEAKTYTVLINGRVSLQQDDDLLSSGLLGYALASGTNLGFGTRCQMTNVELWQLRPHQ